MAKSIHDVNYQGWNNVFQSRAAFRIRCVLLEQRHICYLSSRHLPKFLTDLVFLISMTSKTWGQISPKIFETHTLKFEEIFQWIKVHGKIGKNHFPTIWIFYIILSEEHRDFMCQLHGGATRNFEASSGSGTTLELMQRKRRLHNRGKGDICRYWRSG